MISLINASAFRLQGNEDPSKDLSPEGCQEFLAQYSGSRIRLWTYNCSLSRLELKVEKVRNEQLLPIDLVFVGLCDLRCPVHWTVDEFQIRRDPDSYHTTFAVPSADVSFSATDLTIVVQDEYPNRMWELESR